MTTEERLETLEKELALTKRRIRRLLQGVVCLFAAGCVFAVLLSTMGSAKAQGEKVIRANKFIVEDQNGKPRVILAVNRDRPSLTMADQNGKTRTNLSVETNGPSLEMYDQNEKVRAYLNVDKDGGPGLTLLDQKGTIRALVGPTETTTPDGKVTRYPESSILLFGPDGKGIWAAP